MKIVTLVQINHPVGLVFGGNFPNGLREFAARFIVGLAGARVIAVEIV